MVDARLKRHPRVHLHFASWINQVKRFLGLSTEHRIRRSDKSVADLEALAAPILETAARGRQALVGTPQTEQQRRNGAASLPR
jgi:hypothetical protein